MDNSTIIGSGSCIGFYACTALNGKHACTFNKNLFHDSSLLQQHKPLILHTLLLDLGTVGDDSCHGYGPCAYLHGMCFK